MNQPTLSLCMIVRNEERWLRQCLASVQGLVNEIVIVDTGSTDATPAIAQEFGARVIAHPWNDNFSEARNVALAHATKDWLLVLDADEALAHEDHAQVQMCMRHPAHRMYSLIQTTYFNASATFGWIPNLLTCCEAKGFPGYCESPLTRLFRRCPEIRFHGVVHEHAHHDGRSVHPALTTIRIHHYGGYVDSGVRTRKDDLYLRLGEEKCREEPDNFHAWYELGVQYWAMKREAEAIRVLEISLQKNPHYVRAHVAMAGIATKKQDQGTAIRHYLRVLEFDPENKIPYIYLPALLVEAKRYVQAERILEIAAAHLLDYPPYHINLGVVRQAVGNHRGAISSFQRALALNANEPLAHLNLGISHMELEAWEAARHALELAIQSTEVRLQAMKRLGEWHFRQRALDDAADVFGRALAEYPDDTELVYQLAVVDIQRGNLADAKARLATITAWHTLDTTALERLAQCYRAVGDAQGAHVVKTTLEARLSHSAMAQ